MWRVRSLKAKKGIGCTNKNIYTNKKDWLCFYIKKEGKREREKLFFTKKIGEKKRLILVGPG